jgi:hypothetical protein
MALETLRHIPSNHVHFSPESARVYERFCGNAEWTENIDGIQYLAINTADIDRHGDAGIDVERLERRLAALDPTLPIVALGHHPIWPVNGYTTPQQWVVPAPQGQEAWDVMRAHGVRLYACSHIIAFDVQLRDGIVQLCTGGAGTEYGPNAAMPAPTEGLHFVLVEGLSGDIIGISRISCGGQPPETWRLIRHGARWEPDLGPQYALASPPPWVVGDGLRILVKRWPGETGNMRLLCADEGPPMCGLTVEDKGAVLAITPQAGEDARHWFWDSPNANWQQLELFVIRGKGPGGILGRSDATVSSLRTYSARGLEVTRPIADISVCGDATIEVFGIDDGAAGSSPVSSE